MPRARKRAKYCDPSMDEASTEHVDTQNTDVQKLYRKGLQVRRDRDNNKSKRCVDETSAVALAYEKISKKEAPVLRRLLRSGPPVEELYLHNISLRAFKLAFDDLEEYSSLSYVCLHVDLKGKDLGINFLRVFRGLDALELRCDNPGSGFAKEIGSYIRQNKSLRDLRLADSCGGDEGAAVLIEALVENDTLKMFALNDITPSSDTVTGFAKMLASNSTLEMVHLGEVCCVEVDKMWSLLAQERYASVFQRLEIKWPVELLSVLTVLIHREACSQTLSVRITSSVDERVLREFFEAVAKNKTLRRLYFESDVFDAFANGIASVVKSTGTLREIWNLREGQRSSEYQLITMLNALKENSSITDFRMYAETVTPEVAKSLSELLAANTALRELHLCEESNISARTRETILQGLSANYTLTELSVCSKFDENDTTRVIEAILNRNFSILETAVNFVIFDGDVSDQVGAHALKKVHSSAGFVELLKSITEKTTQATLEDIRAVLARVTV